MSIATLKRKTAHLYHNQSVGQKFFSLNGTHRSQGWVGQTSLSRSLPRTLACGNTIRGSGGLNGAYPIYPSIVSGLVNWNDNNVIKSSVGNSQEMLKVRNTCIKRFDCPVRGKGLNIVKKQNNQQNDYIRRLTNCTLIEFDTIENKSIENKNKIKPKICATLNSKYMNRHYTSLETKKLLCNTTKNASTVLEAGAYVKKINKLCSQNLDEKYPTALKRSPIPGIYLQSSYSILIKI